MEIKLEELLCKLLGRIDVWCETNHDNEVLENLNNYDEIIFTLLDKVVGTASYIGRYEWSAIECGRKAIDILERLKEDLDENLEWIKSIEKDKEKKSNENDKNDK